MPLKLLVGCLQPNYYFSSNNMAKSIHPDIPSHPLPKSVHKLKNSESILFFRSQICRKYPHLIFFQFQSFFIFLYGLTRRKICQNPKPIPRKKNPDPLSRNPKNPKNYPKMGQTNIFFILSFHVGKYRVCTSLVLLAHG